MTLEYDQCDQPQEGRRADEEPAVIAWFHERGSVSVTRADDNFAGMLGRQWIELASPDTTPWAMPGCAQRAGAQGDW
jgi:hypothetical protein